MRSIVSEVTRASAEGAPAPDPLPITRARPVCLLLSTLTVDGSLCGISSAGEASCASGSGTVAHVARCPTLPTACCDRATDMPESRHVATPSASMDDTLQARLEPHFISPNAFREVAAYVQVSWVSATALKME